MGNADKIRKKLPYEGELTEAFSPDGDLIPETMTYPTHSGEQKTIGIRLTADGEYAPESGYTADGEPSWPNQRYVI